MALDAATVERVNQLLEEIYKLINPEVAPEPEPEPEPAQVIEIKPDEVELEGIIGRPELKEVKETLRFTAGLGVTEGNVTRWVNLTATGEPARMAGEIMRGNRVRVVGILKENPYVDSQGVMKTKTEMVASLISPLKRADESVGFAAKRLPVGQNVTT